MAKKDFKTNNPALSFISNREILAEENPPSRSEPDAAPAVPESADRYSLRARERRSRRMQILITPSVHEALVTLAAREGVSVNEVVNTALGKFVFG